MLSSASAADNISALIICDMLRITLLLGGSSKLLEQKKWPPAQLCALASLRYKASKWTVKIMLLTLKVRMAPWCVDT